MFFSLLIASLPVKAGVGDKYNFGLFSEMAFGRATGFNSGIPTTGLFFNYTMSRKLDLQLEVDERNHFFDFMNDESNIMDRGLRREWSMKVALNYRVKPLWNYMAPYICMGAGNYYIQDSKAKIKRGKVDPRERGLDYDMRKHFRHAGFFGALGLTFRENSRIAFYIQGKCSILFGYRVLILTDPSEFSDLINISTGLKFNLN